MILERSCLAVVPAYNEADTIGRVIDSLHAHAPQLDVVVIDDGSTDATCREALARDARVLRHPFNLGIGGAVQSGFKFALENGYDHMVLRGTHEKGIFTAFWLREGKVLAGMHANDWDAMDSIRQIVGGQRVVSGLDDESVSLAQIAEELD